jgi:predicted transposase YdaD
MYWLMQRLKGMSREEVDRMLGILTPLKETRAYKDIAAEVLGEAREEFEVTLIEDLNRWRNLKNQNPPPEMGQQIQEAIENLERRLAEFRAKRES